MARPTALFCSNTHRISPPSERAGLQQDCVFRRFHSLIQPQCFAPAPDLSLVRRRFLQHDPCHAAFSNKPDLCHYYWYYSASNDYELYVSVPGPSSALRRLAVTAFLHSTRRSPISLLLPANRHGRPTQLRRFGRSLCLSRAACFHHAQWRRCSTAGRRYPPSAVPPRRLRPPEQTSSQEIRRGGSQWQTVEPVAAVDRGERIGEGTVNLFSSRLG